MLGPQRVKPAKSERLRNATQPPLRKTVQNHVGAGRGLFQYHHLSAIRKDDEISEIVFVYLEGEAKIDV
jgi:hypothetical protein